MTANQIVKRVWHKGVWTFYDQNGNVVPAMPCTLEDQANTSNERYDELHMIHADIKLAPNVETVIVPSWKVEHITQSMKTPPKTIETIWFDDFDKALGFYQRHKSRRPGWMWDFYAYPVKADREVKKIAK